MTPHDDRRTSQGSASPDRDHPGTIAAVSLLSRRIVRNGTVSVRRHADTHHREQARQIFCNRGEQNRRLITDVTGISVNSPIFRVSSSCQYWGRRRYGPARQAWPMA
jgi:hypothetical protein